MRARLIATQIQKQILAPSMQQSIEVLMLPMAELTLAINQELQNNPLLEISEEPLPDPDPHPKTEIAWRMEHYLNGEREPSYGNNQMEDETADDRPVKKKEDTLEELLLRELKVILSDPPAVRIGEFILGNLNEDGYLTADIEEIAALAGTDDLKFVEHVLKIIQALGPAGIAARDLRECLLAQLPNPPQGDAVPAARLIHEHLDDLGHKRYPLIAKKLSLPVEKIRQLAQMIATLEPRPARNFRPLEENTYIHPDVFVTKIGEQYSVYLNHDNIPRLRISPFYKGLLKAGGLKEGEEQFIREKIQNALVFMKSVEQRGHTLKAIAAYIARVQKDFFEEGYSALKPMTLREIASFLNRNESTISRAINNKYIDTPQGLFPFKFFFSPSVGNGKGNENGDGNGSISNRTVKEELRHLIAEENKTRPLSDQDIVDYFEKKGTHIARRTVTKYRQALQILPTYLRKK